MAYTFQKDPKHIVWKIHLKSPPAKVYKFIASDEGRAKKADAPDRAEITAGWVSVLMALKAAVDVGIDLRNHDARRAWVRGYCDN